MFLKSSNGRIPAGSVVIGINSLKEGSHRETFNIEKCPDKHATVDLSITCECLNEIDCLSSQPKEGSPSRSEGMRMSFGN